MKDIEEFLMDFLYTYSASLFFGDVFLMG